MANIALSESEAGSESQIVYINICRICLKPGDIPIFGDNCEKPDLSAEITAFSGVDITHDDELPQHICVLCHTLLQGAILFRNTAKESEIIIKSNKNLVEDRNLHFDEEDSDCEIRESDNYMSDYSESSNSKIVRDTDSVDTTKQIFKKSGNIYNDSETVIVVVSDIENSDEEIKGNNELNNRPNIEDHSCQTCKVDFETSEDYYQHIVTLEHKNKVKMFQKLECDLCRKSICKEYYVSHMMKHSFDPIPIASGAYKCRICNMILTSEQDLKIHKYCETHMMSISNAHQIECPICHENVRKNDLKSHIKTHVLAIGKSKKQKCPFCNKYFDYTYYNSHLKRMHNIDFKNDESEVNPEADVKTASRMPFVCDKCGKVFNSSFSFKLHCQTHGGELKYKCMFCPYRGLHEGLLKIHVRTHTGDYNYKCEKCPARFLTKSNLNKHMRAYLGPIHYKCEICEKGFYTKLSLERHNEVNHLGIKNHVCNICGKAFGYRNNMMNHQLKVHKREKLTKGKGRLPNYLAANIDEN